MGNYRFRLSDMMPNAWFYKLKDMAKTKNHRHHTSSATATTYGLKKKKQNQSSSTSSSSPNSTYPAKLPKQPHHPSHKSSYPRKSYYFTREFIPISDDPKLFTISSPLPDPPRKSSKPRTRTIRNRHKVVSSVSAGCSCRATTLWSNSNIDSGAIECVPGYSASSSDTSPDPEDSFPPEFRSDRVLTTESFDDMLSWSQSSSCNSNNNNNNNDIVIDVDKKSLTTTVDKELQVFDKIPNLDLPPIITKPEKFDDNVEKFVSKKETKQPTKPNRAHPQQRSPGIGLSKRHSVNSPGGVRLRVNSPRIGNRRVQGRKNVSAASRKSLSESLAIVKASFDPRRDFRESMVEMIVENNIRASKDLEDLLACYLTLNSDEYHNLIINVFKQIWFDLTDPAKLK